MENYNDLFRLWKTDSYFDTGTQDELGAVENDEKEKEDRFFRHLEFGTGGLRGVMGAGTNRMNRYTVGRATRGLANYLKKKYTPAECLERGVVIAYDTRLNSREFAHAATDVLTYSGILVHFHSQPVPTPQLSFAVRHMNALAGIVITASHNPKEYNGYKVYDQNGCQIVPHIANEIYAQIEAITDYRTVLFERREELVRNADTSDAFVSQVLKVSRIEGKKNIKVVYTPLHGTGSVPVKAALARDGFENVTPVASQDTPDGNFPTVISPNPEDKRALSEGIKLAESIGADIVLGTDPDSDRVGIAVRTDSGYKLISGNQIGALILDHIIRHTDIKSLNKPAVVKTIVTSEVGAKIAQANGIEVFNTLTGFKYIGEMMTRFEESGHTFVFGYEESYGFLSGTHARDKDAVCAAVLICEAAQVMKNQGKTLWHRLQELYEQYGYCLDKLESFTLKGIEGIERIAGMMKKLRENDLFEQCEKIDYLNDTPAEEGFGLLPKADVIKYIFPDGTWIAVRPSGTEPKIKIYYSVNGKDEHEADENYKNISSKIKKYLELE
ncbi:MAG: phospho-sugar mutase [Ruminococcaceae bacterium]|nr:phospho-sugar mutase [Oscillospiraceae bacterium]